MSDLDKPENNIENSQAQIENIPINPFISSEETISNERIEGFRTNSHDTLEMEKK